MQDDMTDFQVSVNSEFQPLKEEAEKFGDNKSLMSDILRTSSYGTVYKGQAEWIQYAPYLRWVGGIKIRHPQNYRITE